MSREYVPAAGFNSLTRLYDPIMALSMREGLWRPLVVERLVASAAGGATIVDIGTGTGTLALQIAARSSGIETIAVDGDREALDIARAKDPAESVRWVEGLAETLPLDDEHPASSPCGSSTGSPTPLTMPAEGCRP